MRTKAKTKLKKSQVLEVLQKWIAQRPGLEFQNYGDMTAYRSELRQITKDRHDAETLLAAVSWRDSITADDLIKAAEGAYSGRLIISEKGGKAAIEYCTGQYWPTEYRRAACAVLASALWADVRENSMPAANKYAVKGFFDTTGRGDYRSVRLSPKDYDTREEAQAFADTVDKAKSPAVDELVQGKTPGDWLRDHFKKEFGRSIQKRWFD